MCNSPRVSQKDENIPEYLKLKHSVVQVTTIPVKHAICIKRCVVWDKKWWFQYEPQIQSHKYKRLESQAFDLHRGVSLLGICKPASQKLTEIYLINDG